MPRPQARARARTAMLFGVFCLVTSGSAPPSRAEPAESDRSSGSEVDALRKELEATRSELGEARAQLEQTRQVLDALTERVESLEAPPSAGTARAPAALPAPTTAAAAPPATTARLAPVNVDNPAISFVVDAAGFADTRSSWQSIGFPDGVDFSLLSGELFISAPIDPFLRGYAALVGSSDEGFDIEEAALVTTALPWSLAVKGGRFFADVGRLSHWHQEALPFVDRPPSLERIIGGESTAEGVEVSWLAPTDLYLELVGGVYDAVGAEVLEEQNEEGFFGRRSFDEIHYLGRLQTYVDLTDTLGLDLGGTFVAVPEGDDRNLFGVDATLRHFSGTQGFYQGLVWGTEWFWNDQRFTERDDGGLVLERVREQRQGGYSYLEAFFARRYSAGARFDYSEVPEGDADRAKVASLFATWRPSEFQRLRFQVDHAWGDQPDNQRFSLQWTAFIGSHVHGFDQR